MRRTEFLTEKRDFQKLGVGILMQGDVVSCGPEDTARTIASKLTKYNIGSVPVVDGQDRLLGLVSEFDLLDAMIDGKNLEDIRAEEIMTKDLIVAQEDTSVGELIRLLDDKHLIRVPVVKNGNLVGIVARRDVLFGYVKCTSTYWP